MARKSPYTTYNQILQIPQLPRPGRVQEYLTGIRCQQEHIHVTEHEKANAWRKRHASERRLQTDIVQGFKTNRKYKTEPNSSCCSLSYIFKPINEITDSTQYGKNIFQIKVFAKVFFIKFNIFHKSFHKAILKTIQKTYEYNNKLKSS